MSVVRVLWEWPVQIVRQQRAGFVPFFPVGLAFGELFVKGINNSNTAHFTQDIELAK